MGKYITTPETISGKVKVRLPAQAQALSGRYVFLNLQNAEPNLGTPVSPGSACPDPDGIRYALLSNNSYATSTASSSGWRVWSVDSPRIAAYANKSSLAIGNGQPVNSNSLVFSNYNYASNNIYNSQTFDENTFNVFAMSGIYLFDPTTIGDPASATSFIVTDSGFVGINTDTPNTNLTVNGSFSARNNATIQQNLVVNGNSTLGNDKFDTNILRGTVKIGDSSSTAILFGESNIPANYDTNLYRESADILKTDDTFHCYALSSTQGLTGADISLTTANVTNLVTATASGDFLLININGSNRYIRLWDFN